MIYIAYFLCLLFLLNLERQQKNVNNKVRVIIPLVYTFFIGLRGANVGVDTPVYYEHYYIFGEFGCDFVEIGFDWINRYCYHQGWSQAPFFCICAAFAIAPVSYAVHKRLTRKEYTYYMLLFCTTTFISLCNGMRQNMACGIFFALIVLMQDTNLKKWKKTSIYIAVITFASLFHASIFFVLPLYLMKNLKMSNKFYLVLYLLSFLMVYTNFSQYIPDISIGVREYGRYADGEMTNKAASSLGFIVTSIRNLMILTLMFKMDAFKKYPMYANLTFLMFVLANVGFNIPMMGRLTMYFSFFYILLLSKVFAGAEFKNSQARYLVVGLASIIIVLSIYGITSPANKVLPYTFTWEENNYTRYLER